MNAPARLGLYGLVLVAVFGVSAFTASAVVPEETVRSWAQEAETGAHHEEEGDMKGDAEHVEHEANADSGAASLGLSVEQSGYELAAVTAPGATEAAGLLSLTVLGSDGRPVTDFEVEHEKELHLIVVRADGQHFAHVHPEMDERGTWTIPWQWEAAGSYRVFADFVPAETGEGVTLSTTVQVSGDYEAVPAEPVAETSVDGFDVAVEGELVAGEASELTMIITRDGEPVTGFEPYLGAFGHLVALRDGDLAYLHVHPHGDAPEPGETSGPEVVFEATAPTEGRYLLFLDFQVNGEVRTAPLVLDTSGGATVAGGATGAGDGNGEDGADVGHEEEEGAGHGH